MFDKGTSLRSTVSEVTSPNKLKKTHSLKEQKLSPRKFSACSGPECLGDRWEHFWKKETFTAYSLHQPAVSSWNSNLQRCLSRRTAPKMSYHFSGTRLQFQPAVLSEGLEKSAGWWESML